MWQLSTIDNKFDVKVWFSDGQDLFLPQGGRSSSVRLIIGDKGCIDFTDHIPLDATHNCSLDLNGNNVYYFGASAKIDLVLKRNGSFLFSVNGSRLLDGTLKPLPKVSEADAEYFRRRIAANYVPYPEVSGHPNKTHAEIRGLGRQYFPFSAHSFELAMAVYDWTTPSFARMVIMKMFEYTSIQARTNTLTFGYTMLTRCRPSNPDYMRSFMMRPARSQQEVLNQLDSVQLDLQEFSAVENRLLRAAITAMPRTPISATPFLYSGQVGMSQLGIDRFGAEFLECPRNAGPKGVALRVPIEDALATFLKPGRTVTTKQIWSFSDSFNTAMDYQNGIVLIVEPPNNNSGVWEDMCHVTPLSIDPKKVEWVCPAGTSFFVLSAEQKRVSGELVFIIRLKLCAPCDPSFSAGLSRNELVGRRMC